MHPFPDEEEAFAEDGERVSSLPEEPPEPAAVLRIQAARQAVLAQLGVLALGRIDLQTLLDEAVERVRESLSIDTCNVLELLPGGEGFTNRAGTGWRGKLPSTHVVESGRYSQAGYTLLSSEPVVVTDTRTETRFQVAPFLLQNGIRSGMTVLIHGRDCPYGVFGVQSKSKRQFTKAECDYFQAAANVLGSAIERIRAEGELSQSEESFRMLIEHSPEAILVSHQDRVLYVNRALVTSLGYDRAEDLLGMPTFDLLHPDDRRPVQGMRDAMKLSGKSLPARELRFLRKDGSIVLVESVGVPVVFGGKAALAGILRDIGERRKLEIQLARNDRLASLGTLAAGVAHEINNPLSYVLGNLDYLGASVLEARADAAALRSLADPGAAAVLDRLLGRFLDMASMVENAREGGDRVRRIVADLKTFSRGESDHPPTVVDVRKVMGSSLNIARNEIRHRAQLVLEYGEVPPVMASDSRLGQVFLNLLLNAAQAIPDGAALRNRITIRTSTLPSGRALIEVADTGAGIAPDVLGRLFDPFFTTKPTGVGTGLGLAICHNIVTGYGGDIAVTSELQRGSTFRITFPAATVLPTQPSVQETAFPLPFRGKVLIVDDEPFVAAMCRRMLAGEHDVEVTTDASSALALLQSGQQIDVVVCDLMMPAMSGMELHDTVKRGRPDMADRFLFLSGGAFSASARTFRERVPNTFLDKPCAPDLLRRTVRALVRAGRH